MNITLDHVVARSPEHIFNQIDDEVVLLSIESGDFYGFDKILSNIWNKLDEPMAVKSVIDQLLTEYNVEPAACEQDVLDVFNKMLADKLIVTQ